LSKKIGGEHRPQKHDGEKSGEENCSGAEAMNMAHYVLTKNVKKVVGSPLLIRHP